MSVVADWLRLERRRRWRSLAALALLIAVSTATVMTGTAGARRTGSALDRLESRTKPATVAVLANTPDFDWGPVRRLPVVLGYTPFGPTFHIDGLPPEAETEPAMLPTTMRTLEAGVVQRGRLFDADRSDEAIASPAFLSRYKLHVGDVVVVRLPTPAQFRKAVSEDDGGGTFTGPRLHLRVVGSVVSRWFADTLLMSPGVVRRYPGSLVGTSGDPDRPTIANALFRLRGGAAAIPQFRRDLARVTGRADLEVVDLAVWVDRAPRQQATFAARCLYAFAAAALLAALFLVGQAVARHASSSIADLRTLRALGMTPRQAGAAAAAAPTLAAVAGAAVGAAGAVVASRWFPIGAAAAAEPDPGLSFDWLVLILGTVLTVVLVAGGAAASAALALRADRRKFEARRSVVAGVAARGGLPVPVVVGTRFALEAGRGRTSVPVRPALFGAVLGVVGILAALTFSHGVADAAGHPQRFGQTFDVSADVGFDGHDFAPVGRLTAALQSDARVTGLNDGRIGVATGPAGHGSVSLYTYGGGTKPLPVVIVEGRMPRAPDEVALAPQSMSALHTAVGRRVVLTGSRASRTYTVTGAALVPKGAHNNYADGGWLTDAAYDRAFKDFKFHTVYVALRSGSSAGAGADLSRTIAAENPKLGAVAFAPPAPLSEVTALRDVRRLPLFLGGFLALLAIGAVGHALTTSVRRRTQDLAVLRALGMTPWQCRCVVVTQATVLAVVGLAFGMPLGVAVGRTIWRQVASYTPFEYVPPVVGPTVLLLVPAALLAANALAAWPGRRAARLQFPRCCGRSDLAARREASDGPVAPLRRGTSSAGLSDGCRTSGV
ncbi:MAG: FtsX-like permease family protein [Jatrophihabitans sp.]|uniref:FtsX-like permease family protein n=1 Tax=Jatrophihabitans sp. TaxID=1932789 RepID=UPI00390D1AE9